MKIVLNPAAQDTCIFVAVWQVRLSGGRGSAARGRMLPLTSRAAVQAPVMRRNARERQTTFTSCRMGAIPLASAPSGRRGPPVRLQSSLGSGWLRKNSWNFPVS